MSNFEEKLKEKQEFINEVIEGLEFDIHSLLEVPTRYALLAGGKRLRPLICMLCAEVVGGDYRETKDAFLALELIHNGTLIHDDILDEDLFRRCSPSVHAKFGGKRAVLTGDALLSLGLKYATRTGNLRIVSWLSDTALKMVQGVALQTYTRRKITTEDIYLNIAYLKSGSLFEAAAALGGLVGCNSGDAAKRLADFGRNFGIAYQIRDDICGVFSEERTDLSRSDILNGDLTLPFIYALDADSIADRDRENLMELFLGRRDDFDNDEIRSIYEETGALDRSIAKMREYAERSRESLNHFEKTEAGDCIHYLLDQFYESYRPRAKTEIAF
ncbi:MAG: polyprenyl synthetase family protein [Candidatus Bathyarchaeia archaeon]